MAAHIINELRTSRVTPKFELPPLILHPFADASGPAQLMESSRANLVLQGLLPPGEQSREDLERKLLDGRYCEVRMLYYVGRDLLRWVEQCMELAGRRGAEFPEHIEPQSIAALLVNDAPAAVQDKLRKWGVVDFRSIFMRAIALNLIFQDVPAREALSSDFLRNYHQYADQLYAAYQAQKDHDELSPEGFTFELFASGEYSRMLEQQWSQ